jgi:hypothetical protein
LAAVVTENDRLWEVLRKVHAKGKADWNPVPGPFRRELNSVRYSTARLMHSVGKISATQAETLNRRTSRLRQQLEDWLETSQRSDK